MNENNQNKVETTSSEIDKHIRVVRKQIDTYLADSQSSDILIIKTHLICEYYLNQIIIFKETVDYNEMKKMSFFQKNEKTFNLNNQLEKIIFLKLKALNDIRNKISHELEYRLTESDVDMLGYINGKNIS